MQAKFYNCTRDDRYVAKVCASDVQSTADVQMLTDANNVTRPIIKVQSGRLGSAVNYVYLSELKRFYFIRSWTMDNGYSTLELEIDVLQTYKRDLMKSHAMIKRNEFKYNNYLDDPVLRVKAPTRVKIKEFPKGFDKSKQIFYLAIVGNQGTD